MDYFQQDNNFVSPPELQFEPNDGQPGTVVLSKSSNRNLNLALNATHTLPAGRPGPRDAVDHLGWDPVRGAAAVRDPDPGAHAARRGRRARSRPRARPCSRDSSRCATSGIFGQEEVLLADRRLLLTAGLRADRSSANGNPDKYFFYPKFAASYRFEHPFGGVDELKFRGAYGQTGNRAAFGALFSPDTTGTIGGTSGHASSAPAPGDPNLKPERQKEIEGGFDATLANGRAQLSLTLYQKNITRPAAGADAGAVSGPGEPDLQLRQHAPEPGHRGLASRCSRCRPGT